MNCKANLDTSSSQPEVYHWENPRICATCQHYRLWRIMVLAHICLQTQPITTPHQPACHRYTPKHTD